MLRPLNELAGFPPRIVQGYWGPARRRLALLGICLAGLASLWGCHSPYRADQGALFGGLVGAGTGAIVGDALGNTGAGAAIGAGVGALSGAVVGSELDQIEARNRAMIEAQLGHQLAAGAVRTDDVVAMSRAGVDEQLIVNHIRAHGMATSLSASDIIFLQQQGVSSQVIAAMQTTPAPAPATVVQPVSVPPVVVHEYHYDPWFYRPPRWHGHWHHYHRRPRPRPGFSWGVSVHN